MRATGPVLAPAALPALKGSFDPQEHSMAADETKPITYKDAGVDIDAGEALVRRIGPGA